MSSNQNIDRYKQKKEIIEELDFYKSIIFKKMDSDDFNSALIKLESALTLLNDYQTEFDLEKETKIFTQLQQRLRVEFDNHRNLYIRRYNNLRKETLTEANLENFIKLLAIFMIYAMLLIPISPILKNYIQSLVPIKFLTITTLPGRY